LVASRELPGLEESPDLCRTIFIKYVAVRARIKMNQERIFKILLFISLAALVILVGHFHLDGADQDHCPLCQLLATGFTSLAPIMMLPTVYVIIKVPLIDLIATPFSSYRPISLRAPPYHPSFPSFI
jgi:hypothetical protein